MTGPYIACPECGGASAEKYAHDYFPGCVPGYVHESCPRCGRDGCIAEAEATPDEIERHLRFWEDNDRWANKVDLRD
jgi:endogenous inhibitor of DNA gyrase (YacG/DUF329 family)